MKIKFLMIDFRDRLGYDNKESSFMQILVQYQPFLRPKYVQNKKIEQKERRITAMPVSSNQTYASLLYMTTESYLSDMDMENNPGPEAMELELVSATNDAIRAYNNGAPDDDGNYPDKKKGDERYKLLKTLHPVQIAMCIAKVNGAIRIATSGINADPDYDIVGVYQDRGTNEGIYVTSDDELRALARRYNPLINSRDFNEMMIALRDITPRKERCTDPDLIAVNNGLFDYRNKMLLPFDPEYVFLSKSHVNFNINAQNPHITMPDGVDWDVESWMNSLSDDPEVVQVLWEILGAIIRPNVSWNKSAWLYSENGNNGKGTLCTLMRNLCGAGAYASIPLKDFSKDFMLEPLTRASAIIVDENDVGTYIDQAANLKAVITNDVISINRKFKTPVVYQFYGFMVQCMNEFPKVKDRSDSFYRRQLFIPMTKRFEGHERKYIKDDYLYRDDVLQYVLYKVLYTTNYYALSEPEVCRTVLDEYKAFNDPVRQFFDEIERCAAWNLLPYGYLYALYQHWFKINQPSGTIISKNPFIREIKQLATKSDVFYVADGDPLVRADNRMTYPEPMIIQYDVEEWMNHEYSGHDPLKKASPHMTGNRYRGLQRYDGLPIPDITHGDVDNTPETEESKEESDNA
jgi:putative DNA primase/helicase